MKCFLSFIRVTVTYILNTQCFHLLIATFMAYVSSNVFPLYLYVHINNNSTTTTTSFATRICEKKNYMQMERQTRLFSLLKQISF